MQKNDFWDEKIPSQVLEILKKFENAGHEAYIVGGCVRDMLLGREPKDWDICTSAEPKQVIGLFGIKNVYLTGLKHGTVTVLPRFENNAYIPMTGYEVTTFRVDGGYSDGRHPDSVSFTKSIKEDLARRDFTINAMAYNPKTGLIDPFDGQKDLTMKIVKCVGNPVDRFKEDALRILRALRFSSQLGFDIEENTEYAMYVIRDEMKLLSNERIGKEVHGIVTGRYAADVIEKNKTIFFAAMPLLQAMDGCEQNNQYHCGTVFEHTLNAMRNVYTCHEFPDEWADEYVQFALLLHDIGKPVSKMTDELGHDHFYGHPARSAELANSALIQLRYSNKFRETIVELVGNHAVEFTPSKSCARRLLNKFGEEQLRRLLKIRECDNRAHSRMAFPRFEKSIGFRKCLEEVIAEKSAFSLKHLAINGKDLIENGFEPGPQMGVILKKLLNEVMEGAPNDKETLLRRAKSLSEDIGSPATMSFKVLKKDGSIQSLSIREVLKQNGIDMKDVSEIGVAIENETAQLIGSVCPTNADYKGVYISGKIKGKEMPLADVELPEDSLFTARLYPGSGDAPVAVVKTPTEPNEKRKPEVSVDTITSTVKLIQKF